jgi:hypothetical protein
VSQNATQSPLIAYFPAAVVERLRASSAPPSAQFFRYLKRLETEPELEKSFTANLFRLLADEESFEWPLDDLGRCLALAVFREHTKHRLGSQSPDLETLDDTDGADWRKRAFPHYQRRQPWTSGRLARSCVAVKAQSQSGCSFSR